MSSYLDLLISLAKLAIIVLIIVTVAAVTYRLGSAIWGMIT